MKIVGIQQTKRTQQTNQYPFWLGMTLVILLVVGIAGCQSSSAFHGVPPQWEPSVETLDG